MLTAMHNWYKYNKIWSHSIGEIELIAGIGDSEEKKEEEEEN